MTKRAATFAAAGEPYRLADLMRLFGYRDENSFRAWRARIGFPAPLPGCTRPLRWDRDTVEAWRCAARAPAPIAGANENTPPAPAPVDEVALARARLLQRAAQRA